MGQSTSEAGTNISRLFEELGDSGSKVSEIIKNKTGKSFTELMQDGESLQDVLEIVAEYAKEAGVQLPELFSSSNAGIGALALLSKEGMSFNEVMQEMANSSGTLQAGFDEIANTSSFKLASAINELKNAFIDIGGAFAPVISGFSSFISGFAKFVNGLGSGTKTAIGYLTGFVTAISPVAMAIGKIAKVIGGAGIFDKLFTGGKGIEKVTRTLQGTVKGKPFNITLEPDVNMSEVEKKLGKIKSKSESYINKKDPLTITPNVDTSNLAKLNGEVSKSTGLFAKLFSFVVNNPFVALGVTVAGLYVAFKTLNAIMEAGNNAYWKHTKAVEEATKAEEEHRNKIKELGDQKDVVKSLGDEYETLSKKTNKSKEDQERLVEIAKELEKIDPNLVEYDNGNIQVRIDKVQELIDKYEKAIEKEKILANADSKEIAYNAKGELSEKYDSDYSKKLTDLVQRKDKLSKVNDTGWLNTDNWKQYANDKRKQLKEYNEIIEEEKALQDRYATEKRQASDKIKNYIKDSFEILDIPDGFSDKTKKMYDNIMDTLDFSDFDQAGIDRVSSKLKTFFKTASEADISSANDIVNSVKQITSAFESGDLSTEEYNKQIDNYIKKYSELTGLSEDDARKALKLPEVDASNLIKVTDDIENAKAKINQSLLDIANTQDMDMRIKLATQIVNDESIPQSIRDQVSQAIADDGQIDDEELRVIMKAVGELDSSDLLSDVDSQLAQDIKGLKKEYTVEAGIKIATKVSNGSELQYFMENLIGKNYTSAINIKVESGDFEGVATLIEKLPKEKQIAIITAMASSGEYSPEELGAIISELPDSVVTRINAQIQNGNIPKELAQDLSEIDGRIVVSTAKVEAKDNVTPTINKINGTSIPPKNALLNADPSGFNATFNVVEGKQLKDKTGNIKANPSPFNGTFEGLQAKKLNDKTGILKANPSPFNGTFNGVQSKRLKDKTATLKARDNASGTIRSVNSGLAGIKSKSVTVTVRQVFQTIGKKISGFFGGGQSVGEPKIIELDQPYKINPTNVQAVGEPQVLSGLVNAINSTEEVAKISASNIADIMATSTKKSTVKPNIDTSKTIDSIKYNIDLLNNMSNILSKLGTQVDTLGAKLQRTWGSNSTKLIKEQISLLTKQQSLTKVNIKNMEGMSKKLKSSLKKQGFKFKDDGSISNYNSKLIAMEKNVEKLKKKEEAYNGKNEKTKNKLAKAYEKANDQLQQTKDKLSEYYDLQFNSIPQAKEQWEEYANAISEAKAEIIRADREAKTFYEDVKEGITNSRIDRDTTKADTAMTRSDLASSWEEYVKWINEANRLLEKNLANQELIEKTAKARANDNKGVLSKYGFNFFEDGMLKAPDKTLDKLRKKLPTAEFEAVKEAYDAYVEDMYNTIPQAENEWYKLKEEIKNNKEEIIRADREAKTFFEDVREGILNSRIDRDTTKSNTAMTRSNLANSWKESVKWINEANRLLEKNLANQKLIEETAKSRANDNKSILKENGFSFFDDGMLKAPDKQLEKLRKSLPTTEFEMIKEAYDAYVEDMYNTIPQAQNEWYELQQEILDNKKSIEETTKAMKEMVDNSNITQLSARYDRLSYLLDKVEAKMESAYGENKLVYMKKQVKILEQMAINSQKVANENEKISQGYKKQLEAMGIQFNDMGDILNLQDIMKQQGTLEAMEELQELVDNYNDSFMDMKNANLSVIENTNSINDLKDSMIELNREMDELKKNAWATQMANDMKVLENELAMIEAQRELNGVNQVELMEQQISLYEKQKQQSLQNLEYQKKLSKELVGQLESYGFHISDDGTINNTVEQLTKLKNSLSDTEFDVVNDYLEEYFEIALDTIPEVERQYLELQKSIEDVEKERLNTTAEVEDKITEMLEKQIEERKKAIEEEADARIKSLEKARNEYQKWRDDVDYNNDYEEQLKTVTELQRKLEIAKRDDSLNGKVRVSSLMKELQEEQKNLEKMVQERIDEQVNQGYEDQIDKLQEQADAEVKNLEDTWTESKIAEAVAQALGSGVFTDINGEVQSLDTALMDFANNSAEYMGVLGTSMKQELLSNLQVALSTMKELQTVTEHMPNIDYNSVRYAGVGYDSATVQGNVVNDNSNVINVDFGGYVINVEGGASVDEQAIKSALDQSKKEIVAEVQGSILKYVK